MSIQQGAMAVVGTLTAVVGLLYRNEQAARKEQHRQDCERIKRLERLLDLAEKREDRLRGDLQAVWKDLLNRDRKEEREKRE